jgi:hypothetical protein
MRTQLIVIAAALLASIDVAAAATPCDESYAENAFRVCWFRGPDPAVGEFLGSELEATQPEPVPVSGFAIDHDWGADPVFAGIAPGAGGSENDISGVWRGRLLFEEGRYQFTLFTSDGVRLYIDEQLIVDDWEVQNEVRDGGVSDLSAGPHDVRVEWFASGQTPATTRLRLHWDRVPTPEGEKASPIVLDVFLLKSQRTCIAGEPWDGVSPDPVPIFDSTGAVYRAFQHRPDQPVSLSPSDPALAGYPLVLCFDFTYLPDEIARARADVDRFAAMIEQWSGGALHPTVRWFEIEGDVKLSRTSPTTWWVPPWEVRHVAEPLMTVESDFAIVLSSVFDRAAGLYYAGSCGGSYGNDLGFGGTGYSWLAIWCATDPLAILHEWEHQLTYAVLNLHGYTSIYPDFAMYPGTGYPACGEGDPDIFAWFPDSHDWGADPDTPWCGGPEADVGISELHTLSHFDGSLAHYPLGFFTGSHCDDEVQDYGEYAVDQGGNCPVPVFHEVHASTHGLGQIEIDPPDGPYAHGSRVSLFATPAEGCFFDGWTGDFSSFDNPLEVTVTSDLEFFAEFTCPGLSETLEIGAVEDGWVRRGRSGRHGTESHLKLQAGDKDAFVKFALDGRAGTVLSATLSAVTSLSKAGTVDVHAVDGDGWQEKTLQGTNAPAVGPLLASATASGPAGERLEWDVTDSVAQAVAERADAVSFALRMAAGDQVYFAAKEHSRLAPPTLVIEWIPAVVDEVGASDDAWLDPLAAGNHGAENHLKVQRARKVVYLKFPLAGLSGVEAATLSAVTSLAKAGTVHAHAVADAGWDEDTLQGPGGPAIGERVDSATAGGAAGEELRWDVTQAVAQAVADGADAIAFALVMSEGNQVYFWSKEASGKDPPLLIVEQP